MSARQVSRVRAEKESCALPAQGSRGGSSEQGGAVAKNVSAPSGTPSFFTEVSRACGYGGRGERLVSLTQLCPWGRHRRTRLIRPQPPVST